MSSASTAYMRSRVAQPSSRSSPEGCSAVECTSSPNSLHSSTRRSTWFHSRTVLSAPVVTCVYRISGSGSGEQVLMGRARLEGLVGLGGAGGLGSRYRVSSGSRSGCSRLRFGLGRASKFCA